MKAIKYISIAVLAVALTACKYDVPMEKLYLSEDGVTEKISDGTLYTINDFLDAFMTEEGNYLSDTSLYRSRATKGNGIYLYSIDTLPTNGPGIYIRGRVTTDDYGGNFYKALVIQQIVGGKQQNIRLSVDMGSASGMFPQGQELLIRCNGLAIGRYANQPQLCVPSYNNNTNAQKATEKIGWNPGRIPAPLCRKNFMLIGTPDVGAIQYDTITVAECIPTLDVQAARKIDGRAVIVKGIHFNGNCLDSKKNPIPCKHYNPLTNAGNPEMADSVADVFAPTTNNVGYPQSRCITDGSIDPATGKERWTLVSTSEYAKYAYFYLPYEYVNGAVKYGTFKGDVRGILGFYMDNAGYDASNDNWSVTICDLDDLELYADGTGEVNVGVKWDLYTRPSDNRVINLRKEWQKGKEAKSILVADDEE